MIFFSQSVCCATLFVILAFFFTKPVQGQHLSLQDLIHIESSGFTEVEELLKEKGFHHLDTEDKYGCTSILWSCRNDTSCKGDPPLLEKAICLADVSSVHYYVKDKDQPVQLSQAAEALEMSLVNTIEISETSVGYKYQNQNYKLLYICTKEPDGEDGCEIKLTKIQ